MKKQRSQIFSVATSWYLLMVARQLHDLPEALGPFYSGGFPAEIQFNQECV